MDLPEKKIHSQPGLNQRDRAKSAASPIKSSVKTAKIFRFVGCEKTILKKETRIAPMPLPRLRVRAEDGSNKFRACRRELFLAGR